MSFNKGRLHTHIEDGSIYELVDAAAMLKHPDTGAWLPGIIYRNADPESHRFGQVYATTSRRWEEKFRERPHPKETT